MKRKIELDDDELRLLIGSLDLVARSLGNGQQQGGLQAIEEVHIKSLPVMKLASKLSVLLPKQAAAEPPPSVAAPKPPVKPNRAERRAAANGAEKH